MGGFGRVVTTPILQKKSRVQISLLHSVDAARYYRFYAKSMLQHDKDAFGALIIILLEKMFISLIVDENDKRGDFIELCYLNIKSNIP